MDTTITAETRDDAGKGVARKLRAAGKIPAVLYADGADAKHLVLSPARLVEIFRHTRDRNTILDVEVEGETVKALVKEAQRHPVSRDILHVDLYAVSADKPVEVDVPVQTVGKPKSAPFGGTTRIIRRTVTVRAPFDKIPSTLEVDVSDMELEDRILASQLPTPEGVEVVFDQDFHVVSCFAKRVAKKK
jgi:large subunit ribosomal protein L25